MRIELAKDIDEDEVVERIRNAKIVEDGNYILIRKSKKLEVYDKAGSVFIHIDDIFYVETYGEDIIVHSETGKYFSSLKLYEYLEYKSTLLRISKSTIVNKNKITKVKPSLNMKFKILINDTWLEVNRTYYYEFKDEIGI